MEQTKKHRSVLRSAFTKKANELEQLITAEVKDMQQIQVAWEILQQKYDALVVSESEVYESLLAQDASEEDLELEMESSDVYRVRFTTMKLRFKKGAHDEEVRSIEKYRPNTRMWNVEPKERSGWFPAIIVLMLFRSSYSISSRAILRSSSEGEYFVSFLKDFRTVAASCNFEQLQSSLITDRIVCGISDKRMKDRLLREENLELDKAIEICKAAEECDKHIEKIYSGNEHDKEMCEIKKSGNSRYMEKVQRHQRNTNFQNGRCGWNKSQTSTSGAYLSIMQRNTPSRIVTSCPECGFSSSHKRCPAEGRRCNRCNRFGHFGKVCRYETKHDIFHLVDTKSEQSDEDNDEHDDYLLGSVYVFSISMNNVFD
ncbi:hypothetical protein JTB14_008192 [Gonioctena quinquepunctata]|nr:hypothetical protein JTB14_008192 [Gonioctena quinquepunctata]